jgi:hypothetical protein
MPDVFRPSGYFVHFSTLCRAEEDSPVSVQAASSESVNFPRRVEAGNGLPVPAKDTGIQVGFNTAQGLAGDDPKAHGNQGAGTRIEQPMQPRHADEPVPDIGPRSSNGDQLCVLAEAVFDLTIPSPHPFFQDLEIDDALASRPHGQSESAPRGA